LSYTAPPDVTGASRRPAIVTAASYLLYLVAAMQLVNAAIAIATVGAAQRGYEQAYADFPELRDGAAGIAMVGVIFGVVVAAIFGAGYVVLGILDSRGKNVARIITWVAGGLGVCCFGFGLAGQAALGSLSGMGGTGGTGQPDAAEVQRILTDAYPSWHGPAVTTIGVINVLAMLAVIVLLALPAANAFFRRPAPTATPVEPGYPSLG
jgi:hypothetical protein